jgi:hypothetical protein
MQKQLRMFAGIEQIPLLTVNNIFFFATIDKVF